MNIAWEPLVGFGLLAFLVFILPIVPAARTLARQPLKPPPKDIPLSPLSQCETFRHLVKRQFGHLLSVARTRGTLQGKSENGRPYIVLGINSHLAEELEAETKKIKEVIVAAGHLDIPGEIVCEREIFAEGKINIGHSTVIRSALSPRDIAISPKARVIRWIRTDRRLDIAEGAFLKGWARADIEITLARRARFEQLSAPQIHFGRQVEPPPPIEEFVGRYTPPSSENGDVKCVRELSVPDHHVSKGDLIATETLTIGEGCRVIGDLRAGHSLILGPHSNVEGALYCDGKIEIHESCQICGPIVAGKNILVHAHTRIGSPDQLTTLAAPHIRIAEGCSMHGNLEASLRGEVFLEDTTKTTV